MPSLRRRTYNTKRMQKKEYYWDAYQCRILASMIIVFDTNRYANPATFHFASKFFLRRTNPHSIKVYGKTHTIYYKILAASADLCLNERRLSHCRRHEKFSPNS